MELSDLQLKALYDRYNATGRFDYLKSIQFQNEDLRVRTQNVMKTYKLESLHDLTRESGQSLSSMRKAGQTTFEDLGECISQNYGFIFDRAYSGMCGVENYPSFEKLVKSGQLDAYLEKGEQRANQRDPKWREKLGLPTSEKRAEDRHIKDFVTEHMARSMGRIVRPFKTLLTDMHALDDKSRDVFASVSGRENYTGDVLDDVGDLVLNGRKGLQQFGVTQDEITILDQGLQKAYRLNLDMRENFEGIYDQEMEECSAEAIRLQNDPVAMRRAKKAAYYKKYFTAP